MRVIDASNVNDAWPQAIRLISQIGVSSDSRAGGVLVAPEPVTTVYHRPWECVLFDPVRNSNPMFSLHEALWMLAGRDDARWLDHLVSDFSSRFAQDDGRMHGAYGKRWLDWFGDPLATEGENGLRYNQLNAVVHLLNKNPLDRQAVIQMWDATEDLGVPGLRDRPCNTHIYLRADRPGAGGRPLLDMTVCCRSNDIVFGCYGANAVHFSILQQYLALRIGCGIGTYTQVSNNWHIYASSQDKVDLRSAELSATRPYPGHVPLTEDVSTLDDEIRWYVRSLWELEDDAPELLLLRSSLLRETAFPMSRVALAHRAGHRSVALAWAEQVRAPDWQRATLEWLARRRRSA